MHPVKVDLTILRMLRVLIDITELFTSNYIIVIDTPLNEEYSSYMCEDTNVL